MRGANRNSCIDESGCVLNVHKELTKWSESRNGGKIVPVHILKTGEKGGVVPLFPALALDGGEGSAACSGCFTTVGKLTHYSLRRRLGGSRNWPVCYETRSLTQFGNGTTIPKTSSLWCIHCIDCTERKGRCGREVAWNNCAAVSGNNSQSFFLNTQYCGTSARRTENNSVGHI
jgi:hypothetical protein